MPRLTHPIAKVSALWVVLSAFCFPASGSEGAWSAQQGARPTVSAVVALEATSCPQAGTCVAVGWKSREHGCCLHPRVMVQSWNGRTWRLESVPGPRGSDSQLFGVDCPSARVCVAVGSVFPAEGPAELVTEQKGASGWTAHKLPMPGGYTSIAALPHVSCLSSRSCFVTTGYQDAENKTRPLLLRWNGDHWRRRHIPRVAASGGDSLGAMSCSGPKDCMVLVGVQNGAQETVGQTTQHWDGATWTEGKLAAPVARNSKAFPGGVDSLDCPVRDRCVAVGYDSESSNQAPEQTLVERWNGQRWRHVATPDETPYTASLNSVSCTAETACTAVGWSAGAHEQPYALRWDGNSWRVERPPAIDGAENARLNGVSCPTTSVCTAVGSDELNNSGNYGDPIVDRRRP
jgi:hypothetical protein